MMVWLVSGWLIRDEWWSVDGEWRKCMVVVSIGASRRVAVVHDGCSFVRGCYSGCVSPRRTLRPIGDPICTEASRSIKIHLPTFDEGWWFDDKNDGRQL